MRKVTLALIKTNTHQDLRTSNDVGEKVYTGIMVYGPSIGRSFCFYRDDAEYMHTSKISNIKYISSDELELTTQNSLYLLKLGESFND